ncbi:hypothetical protein ACIHFC_36595 [Streptomyces sp. NPDC052013]|uniref:hypothetical protein n=1 Tax=Streptomyces sp. NPDC052013 TaxID=3365679 RepID=UPI0037CF34AE
MDAQYRLDALAARIRDAAAEEDPSGFGAITITPAQHKLNLYWKGALSSQVRYILAEADGDLSVDVAPALYTASDLDAAARTLMSDAEAAYAASGNEPVLTGVSSAPDASGLVLLTRQSQEQVRALPAVRASGIAVSVRAGVAITPKNRWNDTAPFWGGSAFNTPSAGCSTGFAVNVAGEAMMMTAGHCVQIGQTATTPQGATLGPVIGHSQDWDLGMIKAASAGWVYQGPAPDGANPVKVRGFSTSNVGDRVCTSGAFSGLRCDISVTSITSAVWAKNHWVKNLVEARRQIGTNAVGDGDSGGPVEQFAGDGLGGIYAKGIILAGDDSQPAPCTGIPTSPTRTCTSVVYYQPRVQAWGKLITG